MVDDGWRSTPSGWYHPAFGTPSATHYPLVDRRKPEPKTLAENVIRGFERMSEIQNPFEVWEIMFGRDPDGEMQLWRKLPEPRIRKRGRATNMVELVSESMVNLRTLFPQLRDLALVDSYFTINLFYPGCHHWQDPESGFRVMRRCEDQVHNLVNVYADLDVGRKPEEAKDPLQELTWRQAAAIAGEIMDKKIIPQATFFVKTGRGVACIWTMRDEANPEKLIKLPPPFKETKEQRERIIGLYKRINKEFAYRLRAAAADKIHDASRYLRIPGSKHSANDERIIWQPQMISGGYRFYTLPELARWAGIEIAPRPEPYVIRTTAPLMLPEPEKRRRTRRPGTAPNRRKGQVKIGQMRVDDIMRIEGYFGGFPQGFRQGTLLRYADCLRIQGLTDRETLTKVTAMAARCNPPYPSAPNDPPPDEVVRDAYRMGRSYLTNSLVRWFHVDAELASALGLSSIIPAEVKQARKAASPTRAEIRERRHQAIREHIAETCGAVPDLRTLSRICAAYGFPASYETIRKDLEALGHPIPARGRPKMSKITQIPLIS
jgi:hypothetical protein